MEHPVFVQRPGEGASHAPIGVEDRAGDFNRLGLIGVPDEGPNVGDLVLAVLGEERTRVGGLDVGE